jgi:uridylate kinase
MQTKVQPIVVSGGGIIARHYVSLARSLGSDESSLDEMGIEISRLNAMLLSAALGDSVYPVIPSNLEEISVACQSGKIVVSGGLHPGQSTNATAALICEKIKADRFLNATDVDGIYDSDPKKNTKAKMFKEITIKKCLDLLNNESTQAGNYELLDIVAMKVIERSKIPTFVIKSDPKVIRNLVMKNRQTGTKITV